MKHSLTRTVRTLSGWATLALGSMYTLLIITALVRGDQTGLEMEARLLPTALRGEVPWKTIEADQVERGISVPANTNVIFHLPKNGSRITSRTLFGRRGQRVRFWGYCFPEESAKESVKTRSRFPGQLFLSEKEQAVSKQEYTDKKRRSFSAGNDLNESVLNETSSYRSPIRNQKDVFKPGETCYLMSEEPLPMGTDSDGDGANSKVEADAGSDPAKADTDGDGISDGLEIFGLGSNPTTRDTDGDGLIDGLEDKNRNGRLDAGETNPVEIDTDRDGLCDGYCVVLQGGKQGYTAPDDFAGADTSKQLRGEDKNLNGKVDNKETDPLKADTDGDGIDDMQEYYNCKLKGGKDC